MKKYFLFMLPLLAAACSSGTGGDKPAPAGNPALQITNRIDVPQAVRDNLGIKFVKVERRFVAQTLRVPGRFENTPQASREQRAPLAGRVTLSVQQFQQVGADAPLFTLDAPEWRKLQQELANAEARMTVANAQVEVRRELTEEARKDAELVESRGIPLSAVEKASLENTAELEAGVEIWTQRVADLEKLLASGAGKAGDLVEARSRLSELKSKLAEEREKRAELARDRREIEIEAARVKNTFARLAQEERAAEAEAKTAARAFDAGLGMASAWTGLSAVDLVKVEGGLERWRGLARIEVRAQAAGIVAEIPVSDGGWVEQGGLVLSLQDSSKVRVRARALQADMLKLEAAQAARILPPSGGALAEQAALQGTLTFSLTADADERVIELIVTPQTVAPWARAGVAVEVEITLKTTDEPQLAIPRGCVVRDELQRIFFRRDPDNPDKVIRMVGDFGITDGRWIVVNSGVMAGDEIVLTGVYELKLTGSGKPTGAGHFHSDGTWHAH